jgi:hypothetical protein
VAKVAEANQAVVVVKVEHLLHQEKVADLLT